MNAFPTETAQAATLKKWPMRRFYYVMYVYIESEPGLYTVGFYDPKGKWHPESDHDSRENAATRVNFLNGGKPTDETEL